MANLAAAVSAVTRHYPLLSGCGTIAQKPFFAALTRAQNTRTVCRLQAGEKIIAIPNDYVGRAIYFFGDLDPKITVICKAILRQGDTALDIGANIGVVSLSMATMVGPSGAVHAFEPQPDIAKMLRDSGALNGFRHLNVHQVALGDDDYECPLHTESGNAGSASLVRHTSGRAIAIPVRDASAYLDEIAISHVRLVKLDVEGFEGNVLRGAAQHFSKAPPDAILFEANDHSVPFHKQVATMVLADLGYIFFAINRSYFRLRLSPINLSSEHDGISPHDVLAVHHAVRSIAITAPLT